MLTTRKDNSLIYNHTKIKQVTNTSLICFSVNISLIFEYFIAKKSLTSAEKASRSSSTENCPTRGFSVAFSEL